MPWYGVCLTLEDLEDWQKWANVIEPHKAAQLRPRTERWNVVLLHFHSIQRQFQRWHASDACGFH